jgi:general secretion pathway protein A
MLAAPEMEQLAQRVIARYHLEALNAVETAGYVVHRLAMAGLKGPSPFPPNLNDLIYRLSRGVPRRINLLCDRALLGAYALGVRQVSRAIVLQAAREVFGDAAVPRSRTRMVAAGALGVVLCGMLAAGAAQMGYLSLPQRAKMAGPVQAEAPKARQPAAAPLSTDQAVRTVAASAAPMQPERDTPARTTTPAEALALTPPREAVDAPAGASASVNAANAPLIKPVELAGALAGAPTDETALLPALAALWQVTLDARASCDAASQAGLHCFHGAGGLAELRQLGRPAILTLMDDSGNQRHALLLALDASGAQLQMGDRVRRVSLLALERRLPGRYLTLWRADPEFRPVLKPGDSGPDVDWIAVQLAALNGEAVADRGKPFGAALAKAVRAFQSAQGLAPDGVVGPKTVMVLNSAASVPEPRLKSLASPGAGKE